LLQEVDLIYAYKKIVIPIEIKSGSTGSLRSLHQFIDISAHPFAIRVYGGEFKARKNNYTIRQPYLLLNLPYYLGTRIAEYAEWLTNQSLQITPSSRLPYPFSIKKVPIFIGTFLLIL